jgi:hypothetical protein
MTSQSPRFLGDLTLDIGQAHHSVDLEAPGSILHAASVGFPIMSETMQGRGRRVVRGDPELKSTYVAAARRPVARALHLRGR